MTYRSISLLLSFVILQGFAKTPSESLQKLIEGNERYMQDLLVGPNRSSYRREEIKQGQTPFATIIGCSDSRVSPEIIFDQGLGDLFIVRIAGNVVGPIELDSVNYSAKYLGSSLVLVLGHESCGAITAVVNNKTADIQEIAHLIEPATHGIHNVEEAIKANIRWTVDSLKKTPLMIKLIKEKKIDCIGAYYHLGTGQVEILK